MRAARITDRRLTAAGERSSRQHLLEQVVLGPPAIECGVPDLSAVEDRLSRGDLDLLWIDVEPEAVLPVARSVVGRGLPVLVSSPGGQSEADLAALAALAGSARAPLVIGGELTGTPGIEHVGSLLAATRDALPLRVLMRLEVGVGGGLRSAVASRRAREALLAGLADALALLCSLGITWTAIRVANEVSPHYWDRLDLRMELAGGAEGRMVVEPTGTLGRTVLDLTSDSRHVQWRRSATVEELVAAGTTKARLSFPVAASEDRLLDWLVARATAEPGGETLFRERQATIADAVETVDRFLYGSADQLKKLDFTLLAEHVAQPPGSYFKDYERRRGLFQHSLIAVPPVFEPLLEPLPGPPVRLLLVRVPEAHPEWSANATPPLGMAQIAAAAGLLGADVELVDLAPLGATGALQRALFEAVRGRTYDVLGISMADPTAWPLTEGLCRAVRGTLAPIVVVGGVGFAVLDRTTVATSGAIDFGVVSEGEISILMLLRHLREPVPLESVPGLWRPGVGQNMSALTDLRFHPPPSYDGLDLSRYDSGMPSLPPPFLSYQFILGCNCRCAFCSAMNGQKPRVRPLERVVADLRHLKERYGVSSFMFLNMINPTPGYVDKLLAAMERESLGIRWCDCGRPALLSAQQLERLASVGCAALVWGLDTGSQRLADYVRKQYSVAKAEEIIRHAHARGIASYVNFIVGMPHETDEDFAETRACVERLRPYCAGFNVMQFQFLPDSVMFETPREFRLRRKGLIYDEIDGRTWPEHVEVMRERARLLAMGG